VIWAGGWIGAGLALDWRWVGAGLALGWRRIGDHRVTTEWLGQRLGPLLQWRLGYPPLSAFMSNPGGATVVIP
jgi:hypothetical protein